MSRAFVHAAIATLALLFAGAAAYAGTALQTGFDHQKEFEAWEKRKLETRMPAQLFPSAAEIRLFAWYHGDDGKTVELEPKGVVLSAAQAKTLRSAVFFTEPPPAIAACCIPRHAFKFYDKGEREIGALDVCFECACARLEGEKSPKPDLMWIEWDYSAIAAIVKAHKLPIHPEPPPPAPVRFGPPRL